MRPNSEGNLEQAARNARRAFFVKAAAEHSLRCIALGHTLSDQAETVLFRLLRGSGISGLAGILPKTREGFIRPMIEVQRSDVIDYMMENGLAWREDSSNRNPAFSRNRIRHQLLPELERDWNPELTEALGHLAELAREEENFWAVEVQRLERELIRSQGATIVLPVPGLTQLPLAAARRLLRHAASRVKGDLRDLGFEHLQQILELTEKTEGSGRTQLPGLDVFRSFDWLRLAPAGHDSRERNWSARVTVPGTARLLPQGALKLEVVEKWQHSEQNMPSERLYDKSSASILLTPLPGSLQLRNWRPGDEYQPVGRSRPVKVKFLFQEARIPLWERRDWPMLTLNGQIVWARKFGAAYPYAPGPSDRPLIRVVECE